jgi:hypothetical protein
VSNVGGFEIGMKGNRKCCFTHFTNQHIRGWVCPSVSEKRKIKSNGVSSVGYIYIYICASVCSLCIQETLDRGGAQGVSDHSSFRKTIQSNAGTNERRLSPTSRTAACVLLSVFPSLLCLAPKQQTRTRIVRTQWEIEIPAWQSTLEDERSGDASDRRRESIL